ncbi:MAG: hypothetical protein OXP09_20975 [Gammaproteobacteria bacterium]|nr:hypothetical protein [Gammaproteobacteria bacterium]MDE0368029.1 hypothetical protein [Gammaproteobacteria bacterium]
MFALIAGSFAAYAAVLIAVGVYIAVRAKSGRDYFATNGTRLAAVIAFALLSAIPTDILTIMLLGVVRNYIDVTANLNLFLVAVAPVVTAIVAIQALLLSRAYRSRPLLHGGIYLGVYAAAHAFWMNLLFNPPEDIVRYAATILIFGFLVMVIIGRFVWLRPVPVAGSA